MQAFRDEAQGEVSHHSVLCGQVLESGRGGVGNLHLLHLPVGGGRGLCKHFLLGVACPQGRRSHHTVVQVLCGQVLQAGSPAVAACPWEGQVQAFGG